MDDFDALEGVAAPTRPIERRAGVTYIAGTPFSTREVYTAFQALQESEPDAQLHRYLSLTPEQTEYAIRYEARRQKVVNDPRRAKRLQGKRNRSAGSRGEEWVAKDLGPAWVVRGGSGRHDIEYLPDARRTMGIIECKRRKGADRTLRRQCQQNRARGVIRTYGREEGVVQAEPLVVLRWPVFKLLLAEAGYEVKS